MAIQATEFGGGPRCSWCDKSQEEVAFLIATPTGRPRAYICDECVAVCNCVIEARSTNPKTEQTEAGGPVIGPEELP
jgi:ATP-dependent Clp protease ATP-binding subunit ClpX